MNLHLHPLKQELLIACRALHHLKLASGPFGNVSVRVPGTTYYLQNPAGIFFENLQLDDFVLLAESGEFISGENERHQGDFIHRAIYKQRPDVNAIVHTHSHHSVLLACLEELPHPWTQVGAAFIDDIGHFSGFTGPVRDAEEGTAIASALGHRSVVMAARHGFFIARHNLAAAVWDMVLLEQISREHLDLARQTKISNSSLPQNLSAEAIEKSRRCIRGEFVDPFWENTKRTLCE